MEVENHHHDASSHQDERPKPSFWRKLGGGSLFISLLIHGGLLLIGLVWILRIIPPPKEKEVDFIGGGGGGDPSSQTPSQQKRMANMVQQNAARVAAMDVTSNFTLPDPETVSDINPLAALGEGGPSGGLGGSGSGGGKGSGHGTGFGSGTGPGAGVGPSAFVTGANPFGMTDPNANALVGNFYDLKQTDRRKATDITVAETLEVVRDFVTSGWNERKLAKYYKAPQTLYQTKIYIPEMAATEAPAAFNCEKEVQPKCWVVVYRGEVVAPKTGKFRFVGAGDDVLTVRFNNKNVFDYGCSSGTTGISFKAYLPALRGDAEDKDLESLLRREFPTKIPLTYYTYPTTTQWNQTINGLAVGATFDVKAGNTYPIDILISELPGGVFCTSLLIEEVGAKYETASTGSPILPLFRLDDSLPEDSKAGNTPPYDKNGMIWKISQSRAKPKI